MLRNLKQEDYKRYKKLINSNITQDYFNHFIINILNKNHIIIVLEDIAGNLIGTGTLLIEKKLTYGGCKMGHIENVLISTYSRGKGHGEQMVKYLLNLAKTKSCYRVDLNCHTELEKFYKKNNFTKNNISMHLYFKENFKL